MEAPCLMSACSLLISGVSTSRSCVRFRRFPWHSNVVRVLRAKAFQNDSSGYVTLNEVKGLGGISKSFC